MKSVFFKRFCNALGLVILTAVLSGCASIISSAATNLSKNLSSAILNQDDPELVRAGAPSYLLLLDSFVEGSPDDPAILEVDGLADVLVLEMDQPGLARATQGPQKIG